MKDMSKAELRATLSNETLEDMAERYNALDRLVAQAVQRGVQAERQACMAAMCEGCREDWPRAETQAIGYYHQNASYQNGLMRCKAQPIRERAKDE